MCGGILSQKNLILSSSQNFPGAVADNCAHGHFTGQRGLLCERQDFKAYMLRRKPGICKRFGIGQRPKPFEAMISRMISEVPA